MKTVTDSHKKYWIIQLSMAKFFAVKIMDLDLALKGNPRTDHYDSLLHTLKTDMEIDYPSFLELVKK